MAKKKIWWVLGTLAMVLVVVATSVSLTIAALQAQVKTGFSISYTAKNVNAVVAGFYEYGANFTYKDDFYTSGEEVELFAPVKRVLFVADGKDVVDLSKTAEAQLNQTKISLSSDIYNDPQLLEGARWELQEDLGWSDADVSNITWGNIGIQFSFVIANLSIHELPIKVDIENLKKTDNVKVDFTSPDGEFETSTQFVVEGLAEEISLENSAALIKQAIEAGLFAEEGISSIEDVKEALKEWLYLDDCSEEFVCALLALLNNDVSLQSVNCNFELLNNTVSTDISGNVNFTFGL